MWNVDGGLRGIEGAWKARNPAECRMAVVSCLNRLGWSVLETSQAPWISASRCRGPITGECAVPAKPPPQTRWTSDSASHPCPVATARQIPTVSLSAPSPVLEATSPSSRAPICDLYLHAVQSLTPAQHHYHDTLGTPIAVEAHH